MKKTKKGFTLIELIVVLAILAVIMAIAVPTAFGSIDTARQAADRGSLDGFNGAIRMQASFVAADPEGKTADDKKLNLLSTALETSGISKTSRPQSEIEIIWMPPTANSCGYFKEKTAGDTGTAVKLDKSKTLYNQLIEIAGGADVPIVK